jgi:hypothetical protein
MIPTFLQSLAATVRDLVRTGKAVHVTNATAAECELLAGLPWGECANVTPADIALGWLLASRAQGRELSNMSSVRGLDGVWEEPIGSYANQVECKRAAKCAELAMLCAVYLVLHPQPCGDELGATLMPHGSTREGARAAWGYVVQCIDMQQRNSMVAHAFEGQPQTWKAWQGMRDRYRRELEAM